MPYAKIAIWFDPNWKAAMWTKGNWHKLRYWIQRAPGRTTIGAWRFDVKRVQVGE